MPKQEHPSSVRQVDTESPRPNRILFGYNNPASAEAGFGMPDFSILRRQRASGPKTGALGGRKSVERIGSHTTSTRTFRSMCRANIC
jgi:hypothetical protein